MAKNHPEESRKRPASPPVTRQDLEELFVALWWQQHRNHQKVMAKLSTLSASLNAIDDQLDKVKTEVTEATATLQKAIDDLKAQIEAGKDPEIPTDAQAALDRLTGAVQTLDDLTPDVPAEPPAEPTTLGARRAAAHKK